MDPSLYTVKAIMILDNDGNRIVSKYYDSTFPSVRDQKAFEKKVFLKTHKSNSEILMLDGLTIVYRGNVDVWFYVVGGPQENELLLACALNGLFDSISQLLRRHVDKKMLIDNLDALFILVDEICDGGIILETEPVNLLARVAVRHEETVPISEQSVAQVITRPGKVLQTAKEQLKWGILK